MREIKCCKVCGKIINEHGSLKNSLCGKHFQQFRKFGEFKDNNTRTIYDPNEIRTYDDYAEIDTYDQYGNVQETFRLDLEDVKFLNNNKWRTVYKGKQRIPYLVTGHTIYFHRLIMGDPNCEIDHIDRNTHNNKKENLRFANRQEQMFNTLKTNKTGIKGLYYNFNRSKAPWHCELQYNNKRYYSPQCATKEEAAYYRYLFENVFMKDMLICNTQEMQNCINKLSKEQKDSIQKYFTNKMKI